MPGSIRGQSKRAWAWRVDAQIYRMFKARASARFEDQIWLLGASLNRSCGLHPGRGRAPFGHGFPTLA
eukprot:7057230-Lingulodinium_polyedra.AAC.1